MNKNVIIIAVFGATLSIFLDIVGMLLNFYTLVYNIIKVV